MTKEFAKILPDTIRTKRLFLRAPVIADVKAMQVLANNKTIHEFLARLPYPYTREHALDFINNIARRDEEHSYAITNKNSDLMGIISLHTNEDEAPELGYWLGEPFWAKGYATEAVNGLLGAALKSGINKIFAHAMEENTGSIKVLKKVGFDEISTQIDDCGQHKDKNITKLLWRAEA
ncbi:MAG: GNAT family N-acetyltransferase [Devosiaceae bacterium]|nr:GNAT family N-acetyltransferase [Devosiaceae bacterium]